MSHEFNPEYGLKITGPYNPKNNTTPADRVIIRSDGTVVHDPGEIGSILSLWKKLEQLKAFRERT